MGNNFLKMSTAKKVENQASIENFTFHEEFEENDNSNGLCLNGVYLPPEVLTIVLTHLPPKDLLKYTLVCKSWCNIIKSTQFWAELYTRRCKKKPKKLPWYVYYCYFAYDYFDRNLLRNGNGEQKFTHWKIIKNYGDQFKIENPPSGADPLPIDCEDFNGHTSCFATSYYECSKLQIISFEKNNLMQYIFKKFKPEIYVSEWVAGRFDCGSVYTLACSLLGPTLDRVQEDEEQVDNEFAVIKTYSKTWKVNQWEGRAWEKIELHIKDYPDSIIKRIVFQHEGSDTQFWKGHYGSKMAGGVVKILFDTIQS